MGPPALLHIQRKLCCGFLSPLQTIALAGFETANYEFGGNYTNHYTTKATSELIISTPLVTGAR
jgi:hypothetical protein